MFEKINIQLIIVIAGIILLIALILYSSNFSAIKNSGNVNVEEKLKNDILNDDSIFDGSHQYADYPEKLEKAEKTNEEGVVEYKGKKFAVGKDNLFNVKEYLPQEKKEGWFTDPSTSIEINDISLIDNREFIGINTVGQSLRNANLNLRPQPPVPKVNVSPWNMSTIEPDTNIKSLC